MITFVLRLAAGRDGLRGTVTHVASGETRTFAERTDLWTFLEEWAAVDGIAAISARWVGERDSSDPNVGRRGGTDASPPPPGN